MQFSIKELRRAKNISQEEMANACGVHVNTYRTWEENPATIKLSMARVIAERLGIGVADIFLPSDTTETSKTEKAV